MQETAKTLVEIVSHVIQRHPELRKILGTEHETDTHMNEWKSRAFEPPAPSSVKHATLLRHQIPQSTWVETGTFKGDTTIFLSKLAKHIFTIEPDLKLYDNAKLRFSNHPNITAINDISEIALPLILKTISGPVCFWLDGHHSGEGTFAGPNDTPILFELRAIAEQISNFSGVRVFIDDVRCFMGIRHIYGNYPSLNELVHWASDHGFEWTIEHDIFIAKTPTESSLALPIAMPGAMEKS